MDFTCLLPRGVLFVLSHLIWSNNLLFCLAMSNIYTGLFLAHENHNYFMSLRHRGPQKPMPLVDMWTGHWYILFCLFCLLYCNWLNLSLPFPVDACWAWSWTHRHFWKSPFCGAEQTLDHPSRYLDSMNRKDPSALMLIQYEISPHFLICFARQLYHCFEGTQQKDIPLNPAEYSIYSSVPR